MRRRQLLKHLAAATAVTAAGSMPFLLVRLLAPAAHAEPSTHLRPPGALQDDRHFVEACIGCGVCGEVCPPRAIRFFQRGGGAQLNTPYINPEKTGCTLCGNCMRFCPTEALTEIDIHDVDMGIAQIDRSACYPWVDRGICGACVVICPLGEQAIRFDFANIYRPVVQEGCVGCGQCVEVCPEPSLPIRIVHRTGGTVTPHRL